MSSHNLRELRFGLEGVAGRHGTDCSIKIRTFLRKETVFAQGDRAKNVMYIQEGAVKLTVVNETGKEAVFAIERDEMIRALHEEHEFSDRFIAYMLSRNVRVEEDLIDQLFNATEKRLARTLLLPAHYGAQGPAQKVLPKVSQEMLAEMVGTTRSRVNLFMNKFRKRGFIQYNGKIHVNNSLLSVVLHE